ncbi:hypothetical protein JL720_7930 [Aureococcus anophagefferens]|nr:hypothetical protein JL720_7930 [Aureococcus anophagefferens]
MGLERATPGPTRARRGLRAAALHVDDDDDDDEEEEEEGEGDDGDDDDDDDDDDEVRARRRSRRRAAAAPSPADARAHLRRSCNTEARNTEASKTTPTTVATFQPEAFLAIDQFITLETPLSNVTPRSP